MKSENPVAVVTLKADEKRYALNRVREIKKEREERIHEECTSKETGLSDAEKMRQLKAERDGNATIKRNGWTLATPIGECFNFEAREEEKVDEKRLAKELAKLRKEVAAVSDAIMLSDKAQAVALLQAFEKTV